VIEMRRHDGSYAPLIFVACHQRAGGIYQVACLGLDQRDRVGLVGNQIAGATATNLKRTDLLKTELDEIEGQRDECLNAEIAPSGKVPSCSNLTICSLG
jgi:hypothetical protein